MDISEKELEERVAILKRFREMLEKQREKFSEYLNVLEKQNESIEKGDTEAIKKHAEIEEQIVNQIGTIQKVIIPLETMYKETNHNSNSDIPVLKTDLKKLQNKVREQNQKNKELLEGKMTTLRKEIKSFVNPYKQAKSIYANDTQLGSIIDMKE